MFVVSSGQGHLVCDYSVHAVVQRGEAIAAGSSTGSSVLDVEEALSSLQGHQQDASHLAAVVISSYNLRPQMGDMKRMAHHP